jgi:deoxyguanosine kinase
LFNLLLLLLASKKVNSTYFVIEGCIGAGKTCLSKKLAKEYQTKLILEQFSDNSFLPKFYEDPQRYAFPLEMSFLTDRYNQLKKTLTQTDLFSQSTIADYFIDKCLIFSKNNLNDEEYSLFVKLFNINNSHIPKPKLIVYLYKDVNMLLKNIKKRGREYEQNIQYEYLENIQKAYLEYFKILTNIPILIIDTNKIDFINSEKDYKYLKTIINRKYDNGVHYIVEMESNIN